MRRLDYILSLGLAAGAGLFVGPADVWAQSGPVSGGAGALVESSKGDGEMIRARPLRGSAGVDENKSQVARAEGKTEAKPEAKPGAMPDGTGVGLVKGGPAGAGVARLETAKGLGSAEATASGGAQGLAGDNWLMIDKPVMMAARPATQKVAGMAGQGESLPLVDPGQGFRPVTPGYALSPSVPFTSLGQQTFAAGFSATQYNSTTRYAGSQSVAGNGYMNVARYGPAGFPSYTYPYRGYHNNPFTGLSSYSNGYAGAPVSPVPFNGGWFQGRSAYYSQPSLAVPVYPVYPVYPVHHGGYCGPMRGGYAPVVQGGSGISVSVQYSSGW